MGNWKFVSKLAELPERSGGQLGGSRVTIGFEVNHLLQWLKHHGSISLNQYYYAWLGKMVSEKISGRGKILLTAPFVFAAWAFMPGIAKIIEESGVSRRSLYTHYGSEGKFAKGRIWGGKQRYGSAGSILSFQQWSVLRSTVFWHCSTWCETGSTVKISMVVYLSMLWLNMKRTMAGYKSCQ